MSFNGSGTFVINSAGQPVVANTVISATVFNALTADLATGLSTCITKDGQTTPTANIPMGSNKITTLAAGTAATDAANLGQVQSTAAKLITVTGTDTITGTMSPALTAYATGQLFYFIANGTNTGAMTINIDGLGAKSITRDGSTALSAGDVISGEIVVVCYDGTRFQMINAANSFGNATITGSLTLSGGTANGVLYLNGSKVATSGTALVFDGTNLGVGGSPTVKLDVIGGSINTSSFVTITPATATNNALYRSINTGGTFFSGIDNSAGGVTGTGYAGMLWHTGNYPLVFAVNNAEGMRLTSTGLGIGTTSPGVKLDVAGEIRSIVSGGTPAVYLNNGSTQHSIQNNSGAFTFYNSGVERMRLDSSGNLGLGVTPSAWISTSSYQAFQVGGVGLLGRAAAANELYLTSNAYSDGTWKYIYSAAATRYDQDTGAHKWYTAPSGTAGNAITFTQALTLDANVNLLLNGTAAPASGVGTFAIFNGTAPTGSVTNGCVLYTEDVSSSSELKVRDEAGNVTTLSPHNFSLIPEGPSEDMAWSYYSERDGKRINIDMLKAIRVLEKLSGEKLVHEL